MNLLKIMTISFLISMCSFAKAQNVFLDLVLLNQNALAFQVGDLDFTSTGLSQNYFNIRIRNDDPNPIDLRLKLQIFYNGVEIASGVSSAFTLPSGPEYILTSQQLSLGNAMIDGQSIEMSDYDVDFGAVENLENKIIQTGNAPAGTYDFILTGVRPDNTNLTLVADQDPGNHTINITNPTYIELLYPGNSVSEPTIPEVNTNRPYLQYQTDVPPAAGISNYNIFMFQKYPEDVTTQDVLNHPPILHVEGYQNNFFQYPISSDGSSIPDPYPMDDINVRVLALRMPEEGEIYYWYAQSVIPTGTGTQTLNSDVFRFKITDIAQQANNAQQILAILEQILGPEFEELLSDLRAQGFDPNGDFTYDGQDVDINALFELAGQIARGEKQIENVEVY